MVLVLDTKTNTVVASIEAGQRPWGITVGSDGKTVYTANGPSNDVSVIDADTRQVTATLPAGRGPWGIAVVERP
jgi:YVTN family beta-propeller protein